MPDMHSPQESEVSGRASGPALFQEERVPFPCEKIYWPCGLFVGSISPIPFPQ